MSETTNNMTIGSQINVGPIKPVDRKTIRGSTPGDFRKSGDTAKASVDAIKNADPLAKRFATPNEEGEGA